MLLAIIELPLDFHVIYRCLGQTYTYSFTPIIGDFTMLAKNELPVDFHVTYRCLFDTVLYRHGS